MTSRRGRTYIFISNLGYWHFIQAGEGSRMNVAALGLIPAILSLSSNRNGQWADEHLASQLGVSPLKQTNNNYKGALV